mgnify:CR=1 FL=1
MKQKEVWRDVVGYEGYYQVSNLGRVKSLERFVKRGNHSIHVKEKFLKISINSMGYYFVVLVAKEIGKTWKQMRTHRLVAMAFIPNPDNLPQVNHKDENPLNNFVYVNPDGSVDESKSNLEWCDQKYNSNYGTSRERMIATRRKRYDLKELTRKARATINAKKESNADIPINQFTWDGKFVQRFASIAEACRRTNIARATISDCANDVSVHAGGFIWLYDNDIDSIKSRILNKPAKYKHIGQYTLDGKLVKVWNNAKEIFKYFKISGNGKLYSCCNGKEDSYKGFLWKYLY